MKTKSFTLVILAIFGMVIFTNYTSKNTKETDASSLLFMLEEEKLARDTYRYLDNLWGLTEFENIKISEQAHMDAVAQQLDIYNVAYTILPEGQFNNVDLQNLYNQFVI